MADVGQVQAPEQQEAIGASRERRVDPRARVLVVEDEHELRSMIALWLESKGYEAVEAVDGNDAIELLQAGLDPDVIVLDLALPRINGRDFLTWLRSQPDHRNLPVIVTSGEYEELERSEADGALAKPYRPDLLAQELERVLGP